MLGSPAAGKGTQSSLISEWSGVASVSTGSLLRAEVKKGSEIGKLAEQCFAEGSLLPDKKMQDLIAGWIDDIAEQEGEEAGFILDGFPRTVAQADALEEMLGEHNLPLHAVIHLQVKDELIIERVSGRLTCDSCDEIYRSGDGATNAAIGGDCPSEECQGSLYRRKDDEREIVEARLVQYREKTEPLLEYYRPLGRLMSIDGESGVEEVFSQIQEELSVLA